MLSLYYEKCSSTNMILSKLFKLFSTPLFISAFFFNINPKLNEVKASNKMKPAEDSDLVLYQNMGISYVCSSSRDSNESDFKKSLSVASTLFVTVVEQKHGGMILVGKKKERQKVNPSNLYNTVSFRLIGGALDICPDYVPENLKKEFKKELKRLEDSKKK